MIKTTTILMGFNREILLFREGWLQMWEISKASAIPFQLRPSM